MEAMGNAMAVRSSHLPHMTSSDLSPSQREIMAHARRAGGIHRISRLWSLAPAAVHALIRKGYLAMNGTNFAQFTPAGIARMERRAP